MKAKHAGILSAILGSICCIGPLLLIALGLGAMQQSSADITGFLSPQQLQFLPGPG